MRLIVGVACALVLAAPGAAAAQAGAKPPSPTQSRTPKSSRPRTPQWEISFRGGFALATKAAEATPKLPAAGPAFTMADGVTPTRAVSSWFLGDGAALFNQVALVRGVTARISPLEADWPVASRQPGLQAGASIARHLKNAAWVEIAADAGFDPLGFGGDARDRIDAARAAYEHAFAELGTSASSIITATDVKATADYAPGGQRLLVSAVVQYRTSGPGIRPYLLAGGGLGMPFGSDAAVTLTGTNRFTTPAQLTIEETDSVRIHYKQSAAFMWILGGGIEHDLSKSSAFRVEARGFLGSTNLTGYLDASPSPTTTTPGGAIVLNGTSPGLQFSSASGIRSTLSGASQNGLKVLTADKRGMQWVLSGAYVRRF